MAPPYADASRPPSGFRLPAGLRRPPFRERARSTETCLPLRVRLGLGARVPGVRGPTVSLGHGGKHVSGLSRQIKAEQWDAVQACLDEQPAVKAALGGDSLRGRAKPWIRRRSYEHSGTYDSASAFAELAGFAATHPTPDTPQSSCQKSQVAVLTDTRCSIHFVGGSKGLSQRGDVSLRERGGAQPGVVGSRTGPTMWGTAVDRPGKFRDEVKQNRLCSVQWREMCPYPPSGLWWTD